MNTTDVYSTSAASIDVTGDGTTTVNRLRYTVDTTRLVNTFVLVEMIYQLEQAGASSTFRAFVRFQGAGLAISEFDSAEQDRTDPGGAGSKSSWKRSMAATFCSTADGATLDAIVNSSGSESTDDILRVSRILFHVLGGENLPPLLGPRPF